MTHVSKPARNALQFGVAVALVLVLVLGHDAAGQKAAKPSAPPSDKAASPESWPPFVSKIPTNLGEPLVENPKNLTRLDPSSPVWMDKKNQQVVMLGSTCKADYLLEFFATYPDRGYESVVVVYTRPSVVHAAMLALGAKPGKPAQYNPKFVPASGTTVEISVSWKDKNGKIQTARAQDWIRDVKTGKSLNVNWVFGGSGFWQDKAGGTKSYLADRGDFISVASLSTAMLDLPIESATALESRSFEGFIERMPPPGTPITLLLKPKTAPAPK
jgi:hypothetical protein